MKQLKIKRTVVKIEPNDEMCSPWRMRLNTSDWSISSSSDCLSDDDTLTPVGENGVENSAEVIEGSRTGDFGSSVVADDSNESNAVVARASSDNTTFEVTPVDIANANNNAVSSAVPETNDEFEEELLANSANIGETCASVEQGPKACEMVVENDHSELFDGTSNGIYSENGLSDIDLCPESPIVSSQSSDHVTDVQADLSSAPKQVEVIALEQKEAEIDCGVEPLPDPLTSESSPSPVSVSPPPRHIITPAELTNEFLASAPWKNTAKQTSATFKTPAEILKHGSVIIRARGKILRKSSRKKNLTNKKLTARRRDSFQEYLEEAFDLKPFIIKLDRYRTASEADESEKLHFLSNFNLKKKGVFPLYSEHAYANLKRSDFKSPRRRAAMKPKRSDLSRGKKANKKPNAVARKRITPQPDISRFSRAINKVVIERWEESAYGRNVDIRGEHSYNFVENDDRRVSTDFSLTV